MLVHEVMRAQATGALHPARLFVSVHDDVNDAVELMAVTSTTDLPVVDRSGAVIGSVSRDDVARALERTDGEVEEEVADLFARIGYQHWHLRVADGVVEIDDLGTSRDRSLVRVAALVVPGVRDVVWTGTLS